MDMAFAKAQTKAGALYNKDGVLVGTVELKFGKANAKKGTVKLSASATLLVDGKAKKITAKAVTLATGGALSGTLAFKAPIGEMAFAMDADGAFTLANSAYEMVGAVKEGDAPLHTVSVGGNWTRTDAKVYVDATGLPVGTLAELLPDGEPVIVKGGKWSFNKAAGVKLSKDKTKVEWDVAKGKTNLSGLKLTYTPKTGQFKGSFKVYTLEEVKGKTKLKKYTANVVGVVVDGMGVGRASIKKPAAGPWPVRVE